MKKIADLYAEVIGVLSQSRFHSVRRRFFHDLRDPQNNSSTIISIIEGMSFIRVKMFPVEELEQWFAFLQVCEREGGRKMRRRGVERRRGEGRREEWEGVKEEFL
jgi:hypothetical protein